MKFFTLLMFVSFSLFAGTAELVKELEELSKKLQASDLTEEQSKVVEGKIKTIKEMLKTQEDKKATLKSAEKNHFTCQTAQTLSLILDFTKGSEEDRALTSDLKHFICNYPESPGKDIYYPNGRQAFSSDAGIWTYPNGDIAHVIDEGTWIYPNGVYAHTDYDEDWYYPNGSVAYSSFYENWYYPNGTIVVDSVSNDWSFPSGKRAYQNFSQTAFFPNEKTFETKVQEYNMDSMLKSLILFGKKDVPPESFKDIKDAGLKMLLQVTWLSSNL